MSVQWLILAIFSDKVEIVSLLNYLFHIIIFLPLCVIINAIKSRTNQVIRFLKSLRSTLEYASAVVIRYLR